MERVVNLGHCRLDDWHESVRRAAVVAVAKIAAGGSQKTNRAEQRQRQQRHAMACWKGWVFGSLFVLDSFLATFKFLNEAVFWIVVIIYAYVLFNVVHRWILRILWWPRRRAISTALSWRRLHVMTGAYHCFFFFRFPRQMRSFHSGSAAVATCWAMDGLTRAGRGLCGRCGLGRRWQKVLFLHMISSVQT